VEGSRIGSGASWNVVQGTRGNGDVAFGSVSITRARVTSEEQGGVVAVRQCE